MIQTLCWVQSGQISKTTENMLRAKIAQFARQSFREDPEIYWIEVPERSGYTEAKLSTSAVVQMRSNRPLAQSERETMLGKLCDIWMTTANKSMNEIVAAIGDPVEEEET